MRNRKRHKIYQPVNGLCPVYLQEEDRIDLVVPESDLGSESSCHIRVADTNLLFTSSEKLTENQTHCHQFSADPIDTNSQSKSQSKCMSLGPRVKLCGFRLRHHLSFANLLYSLFIIILSTTTREEQFHPDSPYFYSPTFIQPSYCQRPFPSLIQNHLLAQYSAGSYNQPSLSTRSGLDPRNTHFNLPDIITQQGGFISNRNVTLTKQYNPILITKDIIINRNARLTIEAGTEILFEKRKGIIVYGTLEILGNSNDKVKLHSLKTQQSSTINFRSQNNFLQGNQLVRLVDGYLPNEGRVQIKFNNHWHSLCTNSKNLTAADIKVICQQVGYQDGYWYRWFPRYNGTSRIPQIRSESFHCTGSETAITQCKRWNLVRAGGGICDYHSDIGVKCSREFGTNNLINFNYWRGIEFINSDAKHEYVLNGQMKQKISKSHLSNLLISDAGLNEVGNATAAIRILGLPPTLSHIEVKNSIYGIIMEEVDDHVKMGNIRLTNNFAAPLFVNTSWGRVILDRMHVENNGGDGIRVVRHEKVITGSNDFCKFANLGETQSYPVILTHEQSFFDSGKECCQEFISNSNQLTVHFPVLRSTPNNLLPDAEDDKRVSISPNIDIGRDASLIIYDDYRDDFPLKLQVRNQTRPQSIVSRSGRLKICHKPASYRTVSFTLVIVANNEVLHAGEMTGMARDFEITNSIISGNEGRGVWVDNPRSGLKLQNTTIMLHNYLAGLHVENGTGEVIIENCVISNNTGHGVVINLAGGFYHLDNSSITDNSQKGLLIEHDKRPELVPFNSTIHIGYSLFARNGENGMFLGNVCRSDAFWNISMNSFISNGEDAIHFESCLPNHDSVMSFRKSNFRLNLSDPDQVYHKDYQELHITHNSFLSNLRRAINMAPIFFVKSFIRHNLFQDHPLAVLHISNQQMSDVESFNSSQAPVNIRVASNHFYSNRGRYVASLGVQENNGRHSLVFTKNTIENSTITEPYNDLRPRSRVSAVIVVSSSNTRVVRNRLDNPASNYEIGSHLEIHSKTINATSNFWGHKLDSASIYRRIFDRKNRYNLAQIEFLQYLLSPEDLEYPSDFSFDRERDKIITFRNGSYLGGEVKGYEDLAAGVYLVQDDIFVRSGSHLILRPGTSFKFQDGVGIMVQGRLDAIGSTNSQIIFTSAISANRMPQRTPLTTTTTPSPLANAWVSYQSEYNNNQSESSDRIRQKRQALNSGLNLEKNVRLSHTTMGRLEVQIDGTWGSVCDYNFDIDDAAVACQQLGMILNKDDWLLEKFQYAANDYQQISIMSNNVLMTNLQCDPSLDTDMTKCKAELSMRGDFDGLCNSVVGIRCFPPSWSGIRFGMGAETSTLDHVTIQKAGMFDYATYTLKPALQIDLNRHLLSSLTVKMNSDSGLGIMYNDVIGRHHHELELNDIRAHSNERHGIELRSKGLTIKGSSLSNNRQNGLDYNPAISKHELNDLMSWLNTPKNADSIVDLRFPLSSQKNFVIPSSEDSYRFFVFQNNPPDDLRESFTISTDPGHMLSMSILNPIEKDSSEVLNMSLGHNTGSEFLHWDLTLNMTSFPMVSPGYKFYFIYSTGNRPRGNMVLYIRSRYSNRDTRLLHKHIPTHLVANKFDLTASNINSKLLNSLVITNSNITKNSIGLKFRHFNVPFDHDTIDYNIRYSNETTNITSNLFDSNHFSNIFVFSGNHREHYYHQSHHSWHSQVSSRPMIPTGEISYNILSNHMRRNRGGIRQFGHDIRSSNNVFHWTINETLFELNRGGGVNIQLPYFWRYDANLSHSMDLNNNNFIRNTNFELSIDGHFVAMNFTRNMFRENKCKNGLIAFGGMEKKMLIRHNIIESNICNSIIDMNIMSHADKLGSVQAQFEFNSLRYNRKSIVNASYFPSSMLLSSLKNPKLLTKLHPQEMDYTMSLRGVQALNMTRNLFVNPELRFELVVGIILDPNERTVNAIENYWGSSLHNEIEERIFDFDDWNSFAVADISPYLTQESFLSATIVGDSKQNTIERLQQGHPFTNKPLGGRLTRSATLGYRREPYIVESDLTVMPNVRLIIDPGVTMEFMPNVGILVLGELVAVGSRDRPIQMRPVLGHADALPLYRYLYSHSASKLKVSNQLMVGHSSTTNQLHLMNDPLAYDYFIASRHNQLAYPIDMGSLRLCKNEICSDGSHIYENNVEEPNLRSEALKASNNTWQIDGFLEIFNMTTLQWVPVCDPLFTEHTARVVCRQMGYTHLSLFKRGRRYTIEQEAISSIRNWAQSVQCEGDESALSSCPLAYGFSNHSTSCSKEGNQFIYIYCRDFLESTSNSWSASNQNQHANQHSHVPSQVHGQSDELVHHWGGIRFACPSGSSTVQQSGQLNHDQRERFNQIDQGALIDPGPSSRSRLQFVNVERAGMLHRRRSPAVQIFQCLVQIEHLAISQSAHHGLEVIASQGNQNFHQLKLRNNLGLGMNFLSLTGSSSAGRLIPYLPLKHLDMTGDIFGLVDICGANKEIQIEERMLLFYRYSSQAVECIKLVSSKSRVKHIGLRMLHFDLFNSTGYTTRPDSIRVYDGNIHDRDSRLLVDLGVTDRHRIEKPELKFYQTTDTTMSIRLHVSGAGSYFGFIAELLTTPVSYIVPRDVYNNITLSDFSGNKLGALNVATVGESSPNLILKTSRFEYNCLHLFGNFTSCSCPIHMELQNSQRLKVQYNLIRGNQGGMMIKSYSHSAVSALDATLESNLFESNQNTNVLAVLGPKQDPYQTVRIQRNIITRNSGQYLSTVVLSRVVSNFSHNIITGNMGKHQIEVIGFDKLPLSYQTFTSNWIYNNTATYERDRSTIFVNSAGQQYYMNYLVNPDNHFEMSAMNWSRYEVRPYQVPKDDEIIHLISGDGSTKDLSRKTVDQIPINVVDTKRNDLYLGTVNARQNWWGFNLSAAVQGRIRDRRQHIYLLQVDYTPYLGSNRSVLSGSCAGGWQRVGSSCLLFVGSRMSYSEARDFCDKERAFLPLLIRANRHELSAFIGLQERDYDPQTDRIWVRSFEVSRDACPALTDHSRTRHYDCHERHAFLCERDPQIIVSMLYWHRETGGLIALVLALITVSLTLCCTVCWAYKSRQRHKEKLDRKQTIYASMLSSRALGSGSALGMGFGSNLNSNNNSLSELFFQGVNNNNQPYSGYNYSRQQQQQQQFYVSGNHQPSSDKLGSISSLSLSAQRSMAPQASDLHLQVTSV